MVRVPVNEWGPNRRGPRNAFVGSNDPPVAHSVALPQPFWADADTRGAGGEVRLDSGVSKRGNPFVQIDWIDVGYYDRTDANNTDARNAFSLYIEDDPTSGDIVVFDYSSLEWSTGDVTGTDGFGGQGAQVGFDAGDGVNYLSLMRPDSPDALSDLLQQGRACSLEART